jgi:hypothetical protein
MIPNSQEFSGLVKVATPKIIELCQELIELIIKNRQLKDQATILQFTLDHNKHWWNSLRGRLQSLEQSKQILTKLSIDCLIIRKYGQCYYYPSDLHYPWFQLLQRILHAAKNSSDGFIWLTIETMSQLPLKPSDGLEITDLST